MSVTGGYGLPEEGAIVAGGLGAAGAGGPSIFVCSGSSTTLTSATGTCTLVPGAQQETSGGSGRTRKLYPRSAAPAWTFEVGGASRTTTRARGTAQHIPVATGLSLTSAVAAGVGALIREAEGVSTTASAGAGSNRLRLSPEREEEQFLELVMMLEMVEA